MTGNPAHVVAATELERQALAWDAVCRRAGHVALAIERRIGRHPDFQGVHAEGDSVRIVLHVTDPAQWARWRAYFQITDDGRHTMPYAVTAEGNQGGARLSVVAYEVPIAGHKAATASVTRPFRLGRNVFDLALPQRDAHGDIWHFQGYRAHDGMPLMSLGARPERCSLANVATLVGPLTPVRNAAPSADPPASTNARIGRAR
ncbi:BN159_2729 family protein [Streptomyces sp. NBC_00210]|uniref:BN159_2729 family protein n=1 Tax=unclassified Streptomyces TaxID=2593676 RepID=UPI0032507F7E